MEHVLRQCLIALRLAERIGLDEQARADVYYTSLLLNVGCHSDAHEQAKWFGDDIALKAGKYVHPFGGLRAAAAGIGMLGAGRRPLHRFRVGLEFALFGHRELDDMIAHHAAMARCLGEQLELPEPVLAALGPAYEQWDGRGWPGRVRGAEIPLAARVAPGLTAREVEVLRLLARGLPNKEIAERLVISPKTVGNHVEHIYVKIGASTRAAAGLFAMQHGLLPEERFEADVAA